MKIVFEVPLRIELDLDVSGDRFTALSYQEIADHIRCEKPLTSVFISGGHIVSGKFCALNKRLLMSKIKEAIQKYE